MGEFQRDNSEFRIALDDAHDRITELAETYDNLRADYLALKNENNGLKAKHEGRNNHHQREYDNLHDYCDLLEKENLARGKTIDDVKSKIAELKAILEAE